MRIHESGSGRVGLTSVLTFATLVLAGSSSAWAQASASSQLDARWQPWIGCWQPAPPPSPDGATFSLPRNSNAPIVCVAPSTDARAASSVDVVTIANGKVESRDAIDASGQSVSRSKQGCNGVESANWSANGRRLYMTSDFDCPGGLKRVTSGLFAISPGGDWINVQSVKANGSSGITVLHYNSVATPSAAPADVAQALSDRALASNTARAAAAANLTTADIVEASHKADSSVVAAWIVDRGQKFNVDANQLVALADAGLPGNVTDAMVAVSYPKEFVVNRAGQNADALPASDGNDVGGADIQRAEENTDVRVMTMPAYSPYGYSPFAYAPYGFYGYGYSPYGYSPYGYSPYGALPYGGYYSPYAAGYGGYYWNSAPVIILKGDQQPARPPAYVVRGHGYTRTAPRAGSSGSGAEPRSNVAPPEPPPSSLPPSQPASSGRTAHQRP
jgi:hypothetical protein